MRNLHPCFYGIFLLNIWIKTLVYYLDKILWRFGQISRNYNVASDANLA